MLKRFFILTILGILFMACSNGETNVENLAKEYKYLTDNMTWKVFVTGEECEENCTHLVAIKVTGDTIINGIKYRIVDNIPAREDGDKIYCYTWDPLETRTHEVLIYDFGAKKGDKVRTLIDGRSEQTYYATVTDVKTVTLLDGRKARKISYDGRATDLEYVGHIDCGFTRPMLGYTMDSYQYLCCSEGDILLHEEYEGACALQE